MKVCSVPLFHHDMVVSSLFQNLEKIYESGKFDNIQIFNRNRECIYDMIRDKEKQPHKILEEQINGKWSLDELKVL